MDSIKNSFEGIREIDEKTLLTLRLPIKEQGRNVPTKGGILLYGRDRPAHFPDCWAQCGRFIGVDKARIFDHIELEGPLPSLVDSIMLLLKKHAMRGADFSEVRRKDVWSIPIEPLREAVVNALVHADWSQRGAPVRVAFFGDRIEIENPGIPRIFRETAAGGGPEPYFVELGLRLRFVFPLTKPLKIDEEQLAPKSEERLESQLAAKVVLLLESQEAKKAELARELGHKSVSGELHKQIRRLIALDWIEMTVPEKPNSRLQKYRLTEEGKNVLERAKEQK